MSGAGWSLAIDFGTSFTTAATVTGDQPPTVVEVEQSRYFPSVVVVDSSGQFLTGKAAVQQASVFPERAVRVPKRALVAGPEVLLSDGPVAVTDLVAAVLRRMVAEATLRHGGQPPERVVLTHPARWDAVPLGRLREAAAKAGITGPELMPEPVAAAWRFARPSGQDGKNGKDGLVGVFDFGGGTLDTAVLRAAGGGYEMAGRPGGDATLGGEDFDEMLLDQVMELARDRDEQAWEAVLGGSGLQARRSVALLRADVRVAKEALSEHLTYEVAVPGFAEGFRLTRQEFTDLIGDRLDGAVEEMRTTLADAGAAPGKLAGMYLSGGSSRIPAVAERLAAGLDGVQPQLRDDPKAAVVLGALTATTHEPLVTRCYRHPGRESHASCTSCGRPACPECLRTASGGELCTACNREGNWASRLARTVFPGRPSRSAAVTWSLIAVNLIAFIVQSAMPSLYYSWAMHSRSVQWYRPLTSAFTELGMVGDLGQKITALIVMALNLYTLYIIGPELERLLGRVRYLAIYLLSAIGAATFFYYQGSGYASEASGAVFGLFGGWLVVSRRLLLDRRVIGALIALYLILSFVVPHILWQSRLGGLATGALLTAAYTYEPRGNRQAFQLAATIAVVAAIAVAVVSHLARAGLTGPDAGLACMTHGIR